MYNLLMDNKNAGNMLLFASSPAVALTCYVTKSLSSCKSFRTITMKFLFVFFLTLCALSLQETQNKEKDKDEVHSINAILEELNKERQTIDQLDLAYIREDEGTFFEEIN